ncbi:hypothetical protein C8035_v000756 [Colletotrichum spinosum]|uniref:Uncharacterized protein n=1 Tax=Colletotrichum spinosum TaxID=1347390 RepID=A0A4R8Q928_9PEZI|nr:hypothetical protein C8035_v000756 [Colletotrichum spinosum]
MRKVTSSEVSRRRKHNKPRPRRSLQQRGQVSPAWPVHGTSGTAELTGEGIFMAGITAGFRQTQASGDGLFLTRPTHPIARQTSESSRNLCVPQRHVAETSRRNVRTTTNPSNVAQRHPHRGKIRTLREAAPPSMSERVLPPCPGKPIPCNTRDVMPRSLPGRDFMHRTRVFPARESGKGEGGAARESEIRRTTSSTKVLDRFTGLNGP